jgi:N-6 DNA Methylase
VRGESLRLVQAHEAKVLIFIKTMAKTDNDIYISVKAVGTILPPDLLQRLTKPKTDLPGLTPDDYHLNSGERLNEAINHSWNKLLGVWRKFQEELAKLADTDRATSLTRDKWLLPLFRELGYGQLITQKPLELNAKTYPISHGWHHTPIHLLGYNIKLDTRTSGVAGAAQTNPHGMVQEFLNRSDDHLWGFISNGRFLRILRDNASLTRQAYLEFDLETMLNGESYADFSLLWLLCHQSRVEAAKPSECWLERWSQLAQEQGKRALDQLRDGVIIALSALGKGFLAHPQNQALKQELRTGKLTAQDYYRQLLRLIYRLIFVLVAENRDSLLDPKATPTAKKIYTTYYSITRLRTLASRRLGTRHADLFTALKLIFEKLGNGGYPELALPMLGSQLFAPGFTANLNACQLANFDLLEAIRALTFIQDGRSRRTVDYKNLGPEELGSVYESLLEYYPLLNLDTAEFDLQAVGGSERKTTGSFYTPASLIQSLLDTALEPVIEEACKQPDPQKALLALKICDPACGSGHFLLAASERLARRLASLKTGDSEPSPEAIQSAKHEIIRNCIYGVDLNPMAVELCKVSLWMESLEPGRPLSFLDHHIQHGNSLIGATPALLVKGVPDKAFEPIEGDDPKICREYKRRNSAERQAHQSKQAQLFDVDSYVSYENLGNLATIMQSIGAFEDTPDGERQKERAYADFVTSQDYKFGRLLADMWCAIFVWQKVTSEGNHPLTEKNFRDTEKNPFIAPAVEAEVKRLAKQYNFFHWHLAFPDVFVLPDNAKPAENEQMGWNKGFDVILGNPPWERIKIQEREWFASRRPDIANAANASQRRKLIENLAKEDVALYTAFGEAKRNAEGESHFLRNSERFPLCGRGDINTYAVFAEHNRHLISGKGRAGFIVPSGIATDDTTKFYFQNIVATRSLASLYDFENREKLFPEVDSRIKFCLLTLSGSSRPAQKGAEFVFFALRTADLSETERRFTLSPEDIALLNPNTRTCPIFRSRRDAELTKAIYRRVPVLIRETAPESNPWGVSFMAMFHMANDSHLFHTRPQLEADGYKLEGNQFQQDEQIYLPLYEATMLHHYDHRWATYEGLDTRDLTLSEKQNPNFSVLPRYWVKTEEVSRVLQNRWSNQWLLGWRDITNNTNERTVVSTVIPRGAVGDKFLLMFPNREISYITALFGNLVAFSFDYAARQKMGSTSLKFFLMKQLPVLPPAKYDEVYSWTEGKSLKEWILPRVLELTYTAWDLQPFARDVWESLSDEGRAEIRQRWRESQEIGEREDSTLHPNPLLQWERELIAPFKWDEGRRFQLRCELDAAFFHLYGINREDVDYIMESFPIVKRKDEAHYGEYRTKKVILDLYDQMEQTK